MRTLILPTKASVIKDYTSFVLGVDAVLKELHLDVRYTESPPDKSYYKVVLGGEQLDIVDHIKRLIWE